MILGQGKLAWHRKERVSDEYTSVFLIDPNGNKISLNQKNLKKMKGEYGELRAKVVNGRKSNHIGDIVCGLVQDNIPEDGKEYILGRGTLFERTDGIRTTSNPEFTNPIGVEPYEKNGHWMRSDNLYKIHNSTVHLIFKKIIS